MRNTSQRPEPSPRRRRLSARPASLESRVPRTSPRRPSWQTPVALVFVAVAALAAPAAQAPGPAASPRTDLDILMEQVLANRDAVWTHLRDYVLDERERFALLGPDGARMFGQDREYTWYARDGIGVRSPVKANGVTVADDERRKAEDEWVRSEQAREARQRERKGRRQVSVGIGKSAGVEVKVTRETSDASPAPEPEPGDAPAPSLSPSLEPRFVSEAYFLRFKFEPGNYYFAGRDTLDGRSVLRIEYLPSKLFADDPDRATQSHDPDEVEIERKMNKVSLVTLWVDPEAKQIVRYTFENVDFGFLPGRSLVRVDGARASMTMATVLDGVWMPSRIVMDGSITLATGTFRVDYQREFSGYRRGETTTTIHVREDE